VLVARRTDEKQIEAWRRGIVLEDGDKTAPADVSFLSSFGKGAWIRVVMGEGKKRQTREVGRLLGLPVVKIIRLRIGTLKLGSLKPRQWRHLTENEVMELKGEKVPTMERRFDRSRTDRSERNPKDRPATSNGTKRNPKDRPKRTPVDRPRTAERTERGTNERPATTDRPKRGQNDQTRSNTKSRTPRR
jgi:23S rRNA pseudouridine2605 synthase